MIDVKVDFDGLFRALTKVGYNILIQAEISENKVGSILMHIVDEVEQEEECNECNGCACEPQQETPNPFIVEHEQKRADMARLGLSDFPYHEQSKIIYEAKKHISEHNITNEYEKVLVHHKMRDHYLTYKEYVKSEKGS